MKTCPHCGDPMANPRRVQCGRPECKRLYNNERMRRLNERHRESGESLWQKLRPRASGATCVRCDEPVRHGMSRSARCRSCHQVRQARRQRAINAIERAQQGTRGRRTWHSGACSSCGSSFTTTNGEVQFCSRRCMIREKASRRRAREAGAKITPGRRIAVYLRDGWTCQLCGDPVDQSAVVPDLAAPVIDHRIPLARGGEHGPNNWQTAHFYCNSVKQDRQEFSAA